MLIVEFAKSISNIPICGHITSNDNLLQDRNFRRQFIKRLAFGLIDGFNKPNIRARIKNMMTSISHRRKVSFNAKDQIVDHEANKKRDDNIRLKVLLTPEHRPLLRVCHNIHQAKLHDKHVTNVSSV